MTEKNFYVEKRSDEVLLGVDEPEISVNDEKRQITSPMIEKDGTYYISIGELSENIGYNYEWNMDKNQAVAVDTSETASIFPVSYDLRKKDRVGVIKNQGSPVPLLGICSIKCVRISIITGRIVRITSPDHMSMSNSFVVDTNDGGEYTMGMAYLLSWQGPKGFRKR